MALSTVLRSRSLKVGVMVAAVPFLLLLLIALEVLPVRAYSAQSREINATTERRDMLLTKNAALRERVRLLKTDDEIKRIARDQFAMVPPGEKLYVIPGLGNSVGQTRTDRIPVNPVDAGDSSMWQTIREFLRFVRLP
jgi:cell division protein FtsB